MARLTTTGGYDPNLVLREILSEENPTEAQIRYLQQLLTQAGHSAGPQTGEMTPQTAAGIASWLATHRDMIGLVSQPYRQFLMANGQVSVLEGGPAKPAPASVPAGSSAAESSAQFVPDPNFDMRQTLGASQLSSAQIANLQHWLNTHQHRAGPVDGLWGPKTSAGVMSYLQANPQIATTLSGSARARLSRYGYAEQLAALQNTTPGMAFAETPNPRAARPAPEPAIPTEALSGLSFDEMLAELPPASQSFTGRTEGRPVTTAAPEPEPPPGLQAGAYPPPPEFRPERPPRPVTAAPEAPAAIVTEPEPPATAAPRPAAAPQDGAFRIVIDPGHGFPLSNGRTTPGAVYSSNSGAIAERDINLAVSLGVAAKLSDLGIDVIMTRTTNNGLIVVDNEDGGRIRGRLATGLLNQSPGTEPPAHAFMSVHADVAGGSKIMWGHTDESKQFARIVDRSYTAIEGQAPYRAPIKSETCTSNDDGTCVTTLQPFSFRNQNPHDVPGILVELGNGNNSAHLRKMTDPAHQNQIAAQLALGTAKFAISQGFAIDLEKLAALRAEAQAEPGTAPEIAATDVAALTDRAVRHVTDHGFQVDERRTVYKSYAQTLYSEIAALPKDDFTLAQMAAREGGHNPGKIDGIPGKNSRTAITAYLTDLKARGVEFDSAAGFIAHAGDAAESLVYAERLVNELAGLPKNNVIEAQTALRKLRHYTAGIDGDAGPKTRAALRAFVEERQAVGQTFDSAEGALTYLQMQIPEMPTLSTVHVQNGFNNAQFPLPAHARAQMAEDHAAGRWALAVLPTSEKDANGLIDGTMYAVAPNGSVYMFPVNSGGFHTNASGDGRSIHARDSALPGMDRGEDYIQGPGGDGIAAVYPISTSEFFLKRESGLFSGQDEHGRNYAVHIRMLTPSGIYDHPTDIHRGRGIVMPGSGRDSLAIHADTGHPGSAGCVAIDPEHAPAFQAVMKSIPEDERPARLLVLERNPALASTMDAARQAEILEAQRQNAAMTTASAGSPALN